MHAAGVFKLVQGITFLFASEYSMKQNKKLLYPLDLAFKMMTLLSETFISKILIFKLFACINLNAPP